MIRILSSISAIFALLVFAMTMNKALQAETSQRHVGWRAKSESVRPARERSGTKAFLRQLIGSATGIAKAEKEPPKSDLQNLLDRRRRDTNPFDVRR